MSRKAVYIYFECEGRRFWLHREMMEWRRKHAKGAPTYVRSTDKTTLVK